MSKHHAKYTDEPIGKIKIIPDFLPSPDELIMKEETVKVTLALTKSSLDFFKRMAKTRHTQYQKMIRNLLDKYADHFEHDAR
ncbi:hypothetical protein BH10PSE19_BH10PSE19_02180 [soil metagenome]